MLQGSESQAREKKTFLLYLLVFRWLSLAYVAIFFILKIAPFQPLHYWTLSLAILYSLALTAFQNRINDTLSAKRVLILADLLLCVLFLFLGGWPKAWFFYALTSILVAIDYGGVPQGLAASVAVSLGYLLSAEFTAAPLLGNRNLVRFDSLFFPTMGFTFAAAAAAALSRQRQKRLSSTQELQEELSRQAAALEEAESRFSGRIIELVQGAIPMITQRESQKIINLLAEQAKKALGAEKIVAALFRRGSGRVEVDPGTVVVKGKRDQHLESWWMGELNEMTSMVTDRERQRGDGENEGQFSADCLLRKSDKNTSMICVPLKADNRYLGLLSALNTYPYFFADDQIDILAALADQAAAALSATKQSKTPRRMSNSEFEKELERVTTKCLQSQEAERKRISRELHDNTAQSLTHLVIRLQKLNASLPEESQEIRSSLSKLISMAERTLEEVHEMAFQMRPAILEDLGLSETINWYLSHYVGTATFVVDFTSTKKEEKLPPHVEIAVLRIVQEALTNIRKYAKASEVHVDLSPKEDELILTIHDNGEGFDVEKTFGESAEKKSLGLMGMQERAELLGGSLEILSHPGEGTKITAVIPLRITK
jgi:signal transduction histidine kinase